MSTVGIAVRMFFASFVLRQIGLLHSSAKLFKLKNLRSLGVILKTVPLVNRGACALECVTDDECTGFRTEEKVCQLLKVPIDEKCGNFSVNVAVDKDTDCSSYRFNAIIPRCPGQFKSYNYPKESMSYNEGNEALLRVNPERFILVYIGLNNEPGTVSLEAFDRRGWYLTDVNGALRLQNKDTSQNPDAFEDDATFWLRESLWFQDTVSLESFKKPGHYIRHTNFRLFVHAFADQTLYKEDASFRFIPEY